MDPVRPWLKAQDSQEEALAALVDDWVERANVSVEETSRAVRRAATSLWVRTFGSVEAIPEPWELTLFAQRLVAEVDPLVLELQEQVVQHTWGAATAGASEGIAQSLGNGLGSLLTAAAVVAGSSALLNALGSSRLASDVLTAVRADLITAKTFTDVRAAVGNVQRVGEARTRLSVQWAAQRAANEAKAAVIAENGHLTMWVAERDACVHCLALAGKVTAPQETFGASNDFGVKPKPVFGDLTVPPRHPGCRCSVAPWNEEWRTSSVEAPEALQREAERSIAKGWATESESVAVREQAAENLLARKNRLPKTVRQATERAIRRGTFTTKPVPNG